ncbi:hypothetical protein [Cuspidothrix issatschenkoi]|uniref:hypothetical protein n=1 Tax=Cuspidothrix issatschenkoi TaxID=230752 RepID=UPI001D13D898|nr:hypothetical protein [Cuspidothrix issatschenkoi]
MNGMNGSNLFSVLIGGSIAFAGGWITNCSENRRQYRRDLQNIYINCIRNLSLVLTLARPDTDSERMDKIETALAESKAFLALLLAHEKELPKSEQEKFEKEVNSFVLGQYENVIKAAEENGLKPQDRFISYCHHNYLPASDIKMQRIVKVSSQDKMLKSPKVWDGLRR